MKGEFNINGIILAGGKSQRMGEPKAFLLFKGKPFIWYCIEALKPLVKEIIVVSDDPRFDNFGVKRIPDAIPDVGPIGGLYTGLTFSQTTYNLVLSCDVPCIETATLKQLIDIMEEDLDMVQFACEEKSHPLIALYHKRCASHFKSQLDQDQRRLREAIAPLKSKTLKVDKEWAYQLKNINTKIQYKALINEIDH